MVKALMEIQLYGLSSRNNINSLQSIFPSTLLKSRSTENVGFSCFRTKGSCWLRRSEFGIQLGFQKSLHLNKKIVFIHQVDVYGADTSIL